MKRGEKGVVLFHSREDALKGEPIHDPDRKIRARLWRVGNLHQDDSQWMWGWGSGQGVLNALTNDLGYRCCVGIPNSRNKLAEYSTNDLLLEMAYRGIGGFRKKPRPRNER